MSMPFLRISMLVFIIGSLFLADIGTGCVDDHHDGGGDDDNDHADDDDQSDDDATDDDVTDDDITDDDAIDDDSVDDDTVIDDDVTDDDVIDDDSVDDDTAIDDDSADDDTSEIHITMLDGGAPGHNGVSAATMPDGAIVVAAVKGRTLLIYHCLSNGTVQSVEEIDTFAGPPSLATDPQGKIHLAYADLRSDALKYANNLDGSWHIEIVDNLARVRSNVVLAMADNGTVGISYGALDGAEVQIRYAGFSDTTKTWVIDVVAHGLNVNFLENDLALDHQGHAHLCFYNGSIQYATNASGSWTSASINDTSDYLYKSIALDADDKIFLVADDGYTASLHIFSSTDGINWEKENVRISPYPTASGERIDLVIDGAGGLHLARYYWENILMTAVERVYYAYKDPQGSWNLGLIVQNMNLEYYPPWYYALTLDSSGHPSVAYFSPVRRALILAPKWMMFFWPPFNIDGTGAAGDFAALRLASNNQPHIAYKSTHGVRYAAYENRRGWSVESVGAIAGSTALAFDLDPSDRPHLAFIDMQYEFSHVSKPDVDWITEVIDPEDSVGGHNSMAIDAAGIIHVSYYGVSSELKYARNSGAGWEIEDVTQDIIYEGAPTSIALDQFGYPVIAFQSATAEMKIGVKDAEGWKFNLVQPRILNSVAGDASAVAVDSAGTIHLVYNYLPDYQDNHMQLYYARDNGGEWEKVVLDEGYFVGADLDIALDHEDQAHIVYYNGDESALIYATNASGEWTWAVIDSAGDVGAYPSLALDDSGLAHVGYAGEEALWYAVFPAGYVRN